MDPTNVALVKLYEADQACREAKARLDAASRGVRVQERKVRELSENLQVAKADIARLHATAKDLELDIKTRDEHIAKLREQQQEARTDKEYKAYLVEIATQKVDKSQKEDESLTAMEQVEKCDATIKELSALFIAETAKLAEIRAQIGNKLIAIQQEIDQRQPARDQAASALSAKALHAFDRLAERFEGEALAAIGKPDKRVEEYICDACNMSLVADVYNRLHLRDEITFCPSCRRILYIPEDMTLETAINTDSQKKTDSPKKSETPKKPKKEKKTSAPVTDNAVSPNIAQ